MQVSIFDEKMLLRLARRATSKGIERATVYLWKVAKNSVRKAKDREKEYDLHILDNAGNPIETVAQHFAKPQRQNETIVLTGGGKRRRQGQTRNPRDKGTIIVRKGSKPGSPPKTWPTGQAGWPDFWLRKGVAFSKEDGVVYVNPPHIEKGTIRSKSIPQILETGGDTISASRKLIGYRVRKKRFKNGKINVTYTAVYEGSNKRVRIQPRPFLVPALEKAAPYLMNILKDSIR